MIVPSYSEVFNRGSVNAAHDKVNELLEPSANLREKHGFEWSLEELQKKQEEDPVVKHAVQWCKAEEQPPRDIIVLKLYQALDTEGENKEVPKVVGEPEKWEEEKAPANQLSREGQNTHPLQQEHLQVKLVPAGLREQLQQTRILIAWFLALPEKHREEVIKYRFSWGVLFSAGPPAYCLGRYLQSEAGQVSLPSPPFPTPTHHPRSFSPAPPNFKCPYHGPMKRCLG
uniref:Uncharacterized protein n=1 Tax=Timema cristinae TaxID=61476 RepID=A0A7R9GR92_TIMCR|nr:unnamed protein product [Timema cristinae]